MIVSSPLRYQGNKRKLMPTILDNVPDVTRAIDAFGGSGTVCANLPHLYRIYNEMSSRTFGLVDMLIKEDPAALHKQIFKIVRKYGLNREDQESYMKFRAHVTKNPTPLNIYVAHRYSHSNLIRFGKNGQFNASFGFREIDPEKLMHELILFNGRMHAVHSMNLSYVDLLRKVKSSLNADTFVYFDPPYCASGLMSYEGGWSWEREHELLSYLDMLDKKNVRFMLSNVLKHRQFENPVLINWIKKRKHRTLHLDINYSFGRPYDSSDMKTDEVLIMNY